VTLLSFWKKRESTPAPEHERIIPLPNLGSSTLDASPPTSLEDVNRAREALKLLKLERQILGSAVTTIYESHTKGVISEVERDRMLERYKGDLKKLEQGLEDNQRIVDLYDLEMERNELIKSFNTKLAELDARLKSLKSGSPPRPQKPPQQPTQQSEQSQGRDSSGNEASRHSNKESTQESESTKPKDDEDQQAIGDSEKRIDQIRDEILKAMDRLEQIEGEG